MKEVNKKELKRKRKTDLFKCQLYVPHNDIVIYFVNQ